ncbi:dihydrolipoamide acetyltransferase family protein [Polaromonas sp. JS666]|uniref:dihydrolipoamide acetyltransferase family protein n=1 Tax=Polaromonas sp. (strain JS666 / ATCC BAA-500) TaxID=296591 RepID=UPI0000464DDD|nr:dihydrolipoamide acetyltransferase family protein [Polaromonas sp. JS666]ABE42240.1 branched-chain alpha-keto acid dehydrogenase E2 component [Polaromonas sp. JS666]
MSIHIIKMPDLGEGITEVELVAWRVKPGDRVTEDQVLADVMTDKATVEIPSPVVGQVLALGGEVGQVLAVGAELIRIEVEGAGAASEAAPSVLTVPQDATASMPVVPAPAPASTLTSIPTSIPDAIAPPSPSADKPIASPAVRRRAWELGIDLQQVAASGAGGRIMQADLDAHVAAHGTAPPAVAGSTGLAQRNDEEKVPVIGLRRRIAQKMQESKRRIPHFTYVEEVDVTELEALRARLNAKWGAQRGHLTLLPLLVRAVVLAVREFPQVNARFDDEAGVVTRHGAVHIGIATQTGAGLMVPVLRHAEARDLWSSAAEVVRLAEAARAGKATRDELTGATLTLTSLGALGGIVSTPVINHPEVAIVGVNRIVERPVMRDGAVVARQMMNLSSSFDHRVVDGVDAAGFVQAVRGYLESPVTLFVE